VVDDLPDNVFVLRKLLARGFPGCEVMAAASAPEAIALALEQDPDGIFADVQMPGVDGIELCRRLKADGRTEHIPVILVTAHAAASNLKARGLDAGADDFIAKPADNLELLSRARVMLRTRRAEDALRNVTLHLADLVGERTAELRESEEKFRTLT